MICILHGYLLEGSGSNLWTRAIIESLCRQGETVHLMAQENHPERYASIGEVRRYEGDAMEVVMNREVPLVGRCILHKPVLGETLPVYVHDDYEEFSRVVPMVDLSDEEVESYVEKNVAVLLRIVRENGITALHANHSVLMSVVAQRVSALTGVPYAIFPHGSALEFAVKRDARFHRLAESAFTDAGAIFTIGEEMRDRVRDVLPGVPDLEAKFSNLHLGVDTRQFEPVAREGRPARMAELHESLQEVPRGRTAEQTRRLRSDLRSARGETELVEAFDRAREFNGKATDADVEERLAVVDWLRDPVLLFVGRLIASKGVHSVLAALPLLLEAQPDLRLIVVGHGPLREPLEALVWAFEHGDREMISRIVERGRLLEGSPEGEQETSSLTQMSLFLEQLRVSGDIEAYFRSAQDHVREDRVIFTGYLTHRQLRFLFPCCDAAVFPSVVKEAGPLVFLEALASGAFPLGTDFAGMRASIDSIADALPPEVTQAMRLSPDPGETVQDIVRLVPAAVTLGRQHREALYQVARDRYDWTSVATKLHQELEAM